MNEGIKRKITEKVLIIGGAGYVGGHLVDQLTRHNRDVDVTVYDSLLYEDRYLKNVNFVRGDIRDRLKLGLMLKHYDTVVWLAALVGDGACAVDPDVTKDINYESVKWFVDSYDGRIIFMSTCSVYGKNDDLLTEESETNPLSVYAKTKLDAEQYIVNNHENHLILRLGTLHGVGDEQSRVRLDLVVNVLTKLAIERKHMTVFGGEQWRPIVHVRDVGNFISFAIRDETKLTGLYNFVQENVTIKDLALKVKKHIPDCEIEYQEIMFEDQRNYKADGSKLKENSVFDFVCNLDHGIENIKEVIESERLSDPNSIVYSNVAYLQNNVEEIR